jgi:hypothetical protein
MCINILLTLLGKKCFANMLGPTPSNNTFSTLNDVNKKVKQEGATHSNGSKIGFVTPLYGHVPKFLFGDGSRSFIRKEFA